MNSSVRVLHANAICYEQLIAFDIILGISIQDTVFTNKSFYILIPLSFPTIYIYNIYIVSLVSIGV